MSTQPSLLARLIADADRQSRAVPTFVSVKELAAWLCVSVRTIRTLEANGDLPGREKRSRRLMYRVSDIEQWLRERTRR